jgi:hypothetical protein
MFFAAQSKDASQADFLGQTALRLRAAKLLRHSAQGAAVVIEGVFGQELA